MFFPFLPQNTRIISLVYYENACISQPLHPFRGFLPAFTLISADHSKIQGYINRFAVRSAACYNRGVKRLFLFFLLGSICLFGCAGDDGSETKPAASYQTMQNVSLDAGFDTVITLVEQTDRPDLFSEHFEAMCEEFRKYNALFDIYNDYEGINNLKTVNDNAGIRPVECDPELIELLEKAKDFYELSDGAFDITMGALLNVWHNYRTEGIALNEKGEYGSLPSEAELQEAYAHRGFEYLEIDSEHNTVFITDPDVRLDVGGIAKGFAAEKAARMLEEAGVDHAAINAGGNNRTIGVKADGSTWNVGIQHPDDSGALIIVQISGTNSFVTSGDYERFYIAEDGKRYQHIIDPATCCPADHYRSVTIITPDSGDADCLSTALTVCSIENGKALLEAYQNKTGNPADAIWILNEADASETEYSHTVPGYFIVYTEGLEGRIVWG